MENFRSILKFSDDFSFVGQDAEQGNSSFITLGGALELSVSLGNLRDRENSWANYGGGDNCAMVIDLFISGALI